MVMPFHTQPRQPVIVLSSSSVMGMQSAASLTRPRSGFSNTVSDDDYYRV